MTRNLTLLILAIVILLAVFFAGRFILSRQSGPNAGLKVTSLPTASIFIDSRNIGRTPFEDKLEPGEYTLKLIPEGSAEKAVTWQGKIKLTTSLLTYINRELGSSDLTSAGEILTLEKSQSRNIEITVLTTPAGATVKLDNVMQGTSPLTLKKVEPGDHTLEITAPGFIGRPLRIRTSSGYNLLANVQLALGREEAATPSGEVAPTRAPGATGTPEKTSIIILETPTGFLRVRERPSTGAKEIGRAKPEQTFPLVEEQGGWYKIQFTSNQQGWVSSNYAKKVE